jgi:hypothetical protein
LLWNIFCLLSLLLFLLSMTIWVRSHFVSAELERFSRYTQFTEHGPLTRTLEYGIGYATGSVGIFHCHGESSTPRQLARAWIYREWPKRNLLQSPSPDDRVNLRVGGFQLLYQVQRRDGWLALRLLVIPFWFFLSAAIPPTLWLRRRIKRPRPF